MITLRAVLAGSLLIVTTAAAQPSGLSTAPPADTAVTTLKSPTTARLLGIIPGVGHMYAGEKGRGLLYLGGTLVILSAGAVAAALDCMEGLNWFSPDQPGCGESPALTVSLIAAGGLWAWSIIDAGRAARRTNAKRARTSLILEPTRSSTALGADRTAVRLGVRIATW